MTTIGRAEITAAADFPLPSQPKSLKADPHTRLLVLYRQDVLTKGAGKTTPKASSPR
jgi:hypothetical protein